MLKLKIIYVVASWYEESHAVTYKNHPKHHQAQDFKSLL